MTRTPDIILFVEVESLGTGSENIPTQFLTKELFTSVFGDNFGTKYQGGSIPGFHTADCYYGTWTKE